MVVSSHSFLSQAGKEVQIADHLLTEIYPLSQDPKLLLNVMRHGCKAIEAVISNRIDMPAAEVKELHKRFKSALVQYDEASTVFSRDQCLVMASNGFSTLTQLSHGEILKEMNVIKNFVYQAGKQIIAR